MRTVPLTTVRGGINKLRPRGAARPDTLDELLNGYRTESGTVKSRPGTVRVATLDTRTRGLYAHNGVLNTFCHEAVGVPGNVVLHILVHPDSVEAAYPIELESIRFTTSFMGAIYVVAEFADGAVYHYWLEEPDTWEPGEAYTHNRLIQPTVPDGLAYRASRAGDPYPAWAPSVPRDEGPEGQSIVEPTVYNDFYYVCVSTSGANPQSGIEEPEWPTVAGAQVIEEAGAVGTTGDQTPPTPPAIQRPDPATTIRYSSIYSRA